MAEADPFHRKTFVSPEPAPNEGVEVSVTSLESGDWSIGHEASIASVVPADKANERGQKVRITFYEGKHPPIEVDSDETLRIIKGR